MVSQRIVSNCERLMILFVSIYLVTVKDSQCEVFSSIDALVRLSGNERMILAELEDFAEQMEESYLNQKVELWLDERRLSDEDVISYVTNPLNAFLMIKRCTIDIKMIAERYPKESKDFLRRIKQFRPEFYELTGAVDGLLRLQKTYKLSSYAFSKGIIDGVETRTELTVHDLFIIGKGSFFLGQDFFAKEYLHMTLKLIEKGFNIRKEVDEEALLELLMQSFNFTGDYSNAMSTAEKLIQLNPTNETYSEWKNEMSAKEAEFGISALNTTNPFSENFEKNGLYHPDKEAILFGQVCRGDVTQSTFETSELSCRYSSNTAFAKLARFRVEELNLDPYILLYYDAIYDEEIEYLKKEAKDDAAPAPILGAGFELEFTNERVAQLVWNPDTKHEIIRRITTRIEDMTGLSQELSEQLQVQNYGIGGHYAPHWDIRIKRQTPFPNGNRIATMLFYMSNVEKGGATVFPYLKLRIPPQKGAAAFWFNLKVSGDDDYFTRHAACPVLLGSKWVANKWMHEHGQEFRRPCLPEIFEETVETDLFEDFF